MFEVDVKNMTEEEEGRRGGDQLRFGVLINIFVTWQSVIINKFSIFQTGGDKSSRGS